MVAKIYILDTPYHVDRPFDYASIPGLCRGSIVKVPFGKADKLRIGVVAELYTPGEGLSDTKLKTVHSTVHPELWLNEEMLGLCLFMKEYTLCTFGEAVRAVLPPGAFSENLNISLKKRCVLNISREAACTLLLSTGKGALRSEGQRSVVRFLSDIGEADYEVVRELPGVDSSHIRALADKGVITLSATESIRNPYERYARERDTSEIVLSEAQTRAYDTAMDLYATGTAKAGLLFGVTGSGKTKVILKAIDRVIADKKTVIMLVPEIALTPQTVSIFCKRYGERVAVIHSALSQGERLDAWRRIKRGEVDLVIGTRSAIFAPLSNIGLIVIDEEHEHTYKSESDPKYHARDIAAYRCKCHSALCLLASATPSLESFYKAKRGTYTMIPLRERYGGIGLPRAIVVDMREELRKGNTSPISDRLYKSLIAVKERGEQAILFLNRRGYSSQISCKCCGDVITCPHCSVSLTYHTDKEGGKLLCHLCGYREPTPKTCPSCGEDKLSFLGFGTQKLEGEIGKYLDGLSVMRMDRDTATGKLAYDRMLDEFRSGTSDILLGTQMVAKGHDFPRVTLVGVALADTSLYLSDFRASERTFSLLTQVIGRAGRAKEGGVAVIQTYAPSNEVVRLACKQDYENFYEGEIAIREELSYPPFCDLVQLTLTGENEAELAKEAAELSELVISKLKGEYSGLPFVVFGPFEAQVYKINEKYRMRMVVKCRLSAASRKLFHELLLAFAPKRGVTLTVDLNPLSI